MDLVVAEYCALREEIVKRIELQHKLAQLTIVFFGTLVGIALERGAPMLLFSYPLVSVCIAMLWGQNDVRVRQIGTYIRDVLEHRAGNLVSPRGTTSTVAPWGWEHYRSTITVHWPGSLALRGTQAALLGSQALALFLGLQHSDYSLDLPAFTLLLLDIAAIGLTSAFLVRRNIRRGGESTPHARRGE